MSSWYTVSPPDMEANSHRYTVSPPDLEANSALLVGLERAGQLTRRLLCTLPCLAQCIMLGIYKDVTKEGALHCTARLLGQLRVAL